MKHDNPTTQAKRRYFLEFGLALGALLLVIWVTGPTLKANEITGLPRTLIALAPMVPVLGVAIAVIRAMRGCDEYMQRVSVESLAIAGGATALVALAYSFLEGIGYPKVSASWSYVVFMGVWLVTTLIFRLMRRL